MPETRARVIVPCERHVSVSTAEIHLTQYGGTGRLTSDFACKARVDRALLPPLGGRVRTVQLGGREISLQFSVDTQYTRGATLWMSFLFLRIPDSVKAPQESVRQVGAFMPFCQSTAPMRARELRKATPGTKYGCWLNVLILSDLVRILFLGKTHLCLF